ncbi:MAG: FG-GAP-like repeat-containing protein [bacterium]
MIRLRAPLVLAAGLSLAILRAAPAAAQFTDVSATSGVQWAQITWGGAVADLDLDGDLDLYAGHHYYSPILYWNDGTGTFSRFEHAQPWTGNTDRHGVLILSLDGRELPDIFIAHGADGGNGEEKSELYRNDGGGNFVPLGGAGGMADLLGRKRSASAADYNRDGRVDVYVAEAPDPESPNSLWRNDGNLSFTDVASSVGLAEGLGTSGGIWGDIDNDGDPDLLVGGEEFTRPTKLFRNDGGTFVDATSMFSPPLPVISGADFGDFDNDGDLDLAVVDGKIGLFDTYAEGDSVTFFFNTRYGDTGLDGLTIRSTQEKAYGRFHIRGLPDSAHVFLGPQQEHPPAFNTAVLTDAYVGKPLFTPGVDRGIWVWRQSPGGDWEIRASTPDINFDTFDGWLTDGTPDLRATPVQLENPGFVPGGPHVYRNDGGAFVEITASLGLPGMLNPVDISWVDYDNDGDLDLHVVDMGTSAFPNAPDALFRNDGGTFTDVTALEGVAGSTAGMGDGGVWGDMDGDGDLDLFLQEGNGPLTYSLYGPSRLFRNDGPRGNALFLDLVGSASGPPAVGARIAAKVGSRTIYRRVQANSWRGFQDPLRVHVGLGTASGCDSLRVDWPSGRIDKFGAMAAGGWRILEGSSATAVAEPEIALGETAWRIGSFLPQPASGSQRLALTLARPTVLDVAAYDVAGRRIATLSRGVLAAGERWITWDGRDDRGARVPSGVYFLRISDGARRAAVRSVRVR